MNNKLLEFGTRGGGRMPKASKMQKMIDASGLFKALRDEPAGHGAVVSWRQRYKIIDTEFYLYLIKNETYIICKTLKGKIIKIDSQDKLSDDVNKFLEELNKLQSQIHSLPNEK